MKKFRIKTNFIKFLRRVMICSIISVLCLGGFLAIQNDKREKQEQEFLLISRERESYLNRLEEVKAMNTIYDYINNGYEKILNKDENNVLIISDSDISSMNRYQIKPSWQLDFESFFNTFTQQENRYNNILLRGSNLLWAYMQVTSDLTKMDYDFGIIDLNSNGFQQLGEDEFILYYEGLLRQLITQFKDIELFVVFNTKLLSEVEKNSNHGNVTELVRKINDDYQVFTLETDNYNQMIEEIALIIQERVKDQELNNGSIIDHQMNKQINQTNDLFGINRLVSTTNPSKFEGFKIKNGLLFNSESSNYIEYTVEESFVFLNYVTFTNGSKFNVYIDNDLYITVDSFSQVTGVGVLALPDANKSRVIRIEALSEPGSGKYLMMDKLLVGK